jgi:hypothetical protein
VTPQSPVPARQPTAAESVELQVITIIHQHVEAITITIVTIILPTGYFTGFPGRTVAVPFAMAGALHLHSATSGRTITADLSSSASAVTGPAIHTGVTTGMDGTPIAGTAAILQIM